MDYSIQKLEKSRVEIAINIEKDEWNQCIQEAYKKNKHHYKIEGFRPGKVPFSVLAKRYGVEIFFEDALDVALGKYYSEILQKEKDLEPVARPEIDINEVSEDGVKVVLTVEVYPEFELAAYKGLKIDKVAVEVKDEDVDSEVEKRREQACRWIDVSERAAEKGDKVTIDYSGSVDGVKFDGGTAEKQQLDLGSGMFIPGFEEQVEGMKVGESKDITVKFPAEYGAAELADKEAVFAITLHEIKTKELPALDDEFAKDVSEFDTLAEYKADIKAKLTETAEKKAEYEEDDKLINAITDATTIDIPLAMIADELDRQIDDLKMRMSYSGLKLEDYLKYTNTTLESIREERQEDATKSVKTRLILEAIIKAEKMTVEEDELDVEIKIAAEKAGKEFDAYKKGMNEYELGRIMNKLITEKLFAFLRANNDIS